MINTDMQIISSVLSTRIKDVLSFLISSSQRMYIKNRFINESEKSDFKYFRNIKITFTRRFSSHSRYRKSV